MKTLLSLDTAFPVSLSVFKPWLLIRRTLQCLAGIFQPAEIILPTDYDTNSISMLLFKTVSIPDPRSALMLALFIVDPSEWNT